ncbi:PREDICTED: uncharacterized protein LOC105564368 [Vollenhovia emeryi]|uniref:uncharacterized protein LOC105564368 n=1 Tax=Vollenhovia emeryi TaxID=411798 RepID=UPI0005F5870F|nr:PREDICTED: uncharacterized protein LOC105564368 [Vollenhovia emeryi]
MKIPFLILCLAVVYGSCRTYESEETDLTTEIENNEDYKLDYANVPLERLLSRHSRGLLSPQNIIKPITIPVDMILKLCGFDDGIVAATLSTMKTTLGVFMGQDCPKVELSLGTFVNSILDPIGAVKTVACYVVQGVGTQSRAMMGKVLDLSMQFCTQVFLPGMHTTLNTLNSTGMLPPQISAMIAIFNVVYGVLKMTGTVPK